MKSILALCESADATAQWLSCNDLAPEIRPVAISPEAAMLLRKRGIAYDKLEDFYDPSALMDRRWELMQREADWVEWVDQQVVNCWPEIRATSFRPASAFLHSIKVHADALYMRAHMLASLCQQAVPSKFLSFGERTSEGPNLFASTSLFRPLIPLVASHFRIPVEQVDTVTRVAKPLARRSIFRRAAALLKKRRNPNRADVVIVQSGYDIDPLAAWLAKKVHVQNLNDWLMDVSKPTDRNSLWDGLTEPNEFWDLWHTGEIDYRSVSAPFLRQWLNESVPRAWNFYLATRATVEAKRPSLFLSAGLFDWQSRVVRQVARDMAIPFAVYQHGGHAGYCDHPLWAYGDGDADINLVYGDGVVDYYEHHPDAARVNHAKVIAVGSARLDSFPRLQAKKRPATLPVILYVANVMARNNGHLDGGWYPDVPHLETELALVNLFTQAKKVRVIWRPFPSTPESPSSRGVKHVGSMEVDRTSKLFNLMAASDTVILGYPGTALLEGLVTDRPILVYSPSQTVRMNLDAKTLLRKRACVAESTDELLAHVRSLLAGSPLRGYGDVRNKDFLRAYGTHLDDGRSVERAATDLADWIPVLPHPLVLTN